MVEMLESISVSVLAQPAKCTLNGLANGLLRILGILEYPM